MINGQQVVARRIARSMSQEELAGAANLSSRTIQRVERGSRASLETTKALVAVLGDEVLHPLRSSRPTVVSSKPRRRSIHAIYLGSCVLSIVLMTLELLLPSNFGLFVWPQGEFSVGIFDARSLEGSVDLLGRWVLVPLALPAMMALVSMWCSRSWSRAREGIDHILLSGTGS